MKKQVLVILSVLAAGACSIALAAAGRTVYYHGDAMSHSVTIVNGRPFVPLEDVARALGGHVSPHDGGYEIATGAAEAKAAPGGANEVHGLSGKVGGDWLFSGAWRFHVTRVEHVEEYKYQFAAEAGSDKPSGPNDELVVAYCTIKNGQKSSDQPILTIHGLGSQATALTDDQGQSYPPIDFDVRGSSMVPGGAKNFAVIFSVPKSAKLHDMIFTMYGYGSSTAINARVALTP